MREDEGTDAVVAGMESLSNKGGDTGLTGTMMVEGGGWAGINVSDRVGRTNSTSRTKPKNSNRTVASHSTKTHSCKAEAARVQAQDKNRTFKGKIEEPMQKTITYANKGSTCTYLGRREPTSYKEECSGRKQQTQIEKQERNLPTKATTKTRTYTTSRTKGYRYIPRTRAGYRTKYTQREYPNCKSNIRHKATANKTGLDRPTNGLYMRRVKQFVATKNSKILRLSTTQVNREKTENADGTTYIPTQSK